MPGLHAIGPDYQEPPGPNGETNGHWYVIYCGGLPLQTEWVPDGADPVASAVDPATVVAAARARLPLKPPTIHMNPDPAKVPALVGLATWFWVNPDDIGTLGAGASQNGIVVDGSVTADHITVDPGDGTKPFDCPGSGTPWTPDAKATNCSHTYARSSAGKGTNNNFTVRVTVVWAGNFTVTIVGAPAGGGVLGPIDETADAPVRVAEAQAINNG